MKKVMTVFGTRPEAIKMAPVIKLLESQQDMEHVVCFTGQHAELVTPVLSFFGIRVDYCLNIMKENQDLFYITETVMKLLREIFEKEKPQLVLVQGDTTSAFAAALAAYYMQIPVAHIEAGLRTRSQEPWPEEFNRGAIDAMSALLFAPTEENRANLLREGRQPGCIAVTGNPVVDVLGYTLRDDYSHAELRWAEGSRLIVFTAHRRENQGEPMEDMLKALRWVVQQYPDVRVIFPVHPNPAVRDMVREQLKGEEHIHLVEPMELPDFHNILKRCYLIMTDSGGIQEEALSLGKPVIVMRNSTERPEGVQAGAALVTGTSSIGIFAICSRLLDDEEFYRGMVAKSNPYGDGQASGRILRRIRTYLGV